MANKPYLDYLFRYDGQGQTAQTDADDHLRDLIHLVLFTSPGERVNRPDFGSGLRQLVFMPNSEVLATATQFLVQGALQRWLSALIKVRSVEVSSDDGRLVVDISYLRLQDGQRRNERFIAPATGSEL